jgi:hypothetical protein
MFYILRLKTIPNARYGIKKVLTQSREEAQDSPKKKKWF